MYKIVGADGREYGPITLEQLADWIRQGRASARTLVQFNDGPWQPLGNFPELATHLAATAGGATPLATPPSVPMPLTPSAGPSAGGSASEGPRFSQADTGAPPPPRRYIMRGADGREYGATFEQLRDWLRENRANAQTMLRYEESNDWRPLGTFPEFAAFLPAGARPSASSFQPDPPPGATGDPHLFSEHIRGRGFDLRVGYSLSRGWELFKANTGLMIGALFVAFLVAATVGGICSFLTQLIFGSGSRSEWHQVPLAILFNVPSMIINTLMTAGYLTLVMNLVRGKPAGLENLFVGFSRLIGPLIALELVRSILVSIGVLFCVLPGIYLAIAYMFALPIMLDHRYGFWDCLEVSRKVVTDRWFDALIFVIVVGLLMFAGALVCLVGLLVTVPLGAAAFIYAYEDVFDINRPRY